VLVILSLICQIFVEHAALGPGFTWLVRIGVPLAAILIPLGFFLSVAFTPDRPNEWIRTLYAGALVLALSVIVLGRRGWKAPPGRRCQAGIASRLNSFLTCVVTDVAFPASRSPARSHPRGPQPRFVASMIAESPGRTSRKVDF
jgi:hypothetical protein